ncbi:MAG: patatin-like phospholipase family protein, partial [Vicinamibacterales bacterium]
MTPEPTRVPDFTAVKAAELERHIGKTADEPIVGLAFSGGGIRSATFGLGVLQALHSLGVFRHVDYVSTVSGGGYIGCWLQGAIARARMHGALSTGGNEPRDVRFLRAYSNYLTPHLGLFSGDTWAAVGNSARNLVLNLSVLSLSLLAPLYLPWLAALLFWRLVPVEPATQWPLWVAGALLALMVGVSTLNMARPLKDGTWAKQGSLQASPWKVQALVILPSLAAAWLLSTVAWAWARHEWLESQTYLLDVVLRGGLAFGAIWLVGAVGGYYVGARWRRTARDGGAADPADGKSDLRAAIRGLIVLVLSATFAGMIGTFVLAVSTQAFVGLVRGTHTWLTSLLVFPIAVISLLVTITAHIGLSGHRLSDETREWFGRVGGLQLLATGLIVVLSALSLAGPYLFPFIAGVAERARMNPSLVTSVVGALWAGITGAGVLAGKSARTARGDGGLLERIGSFAPVVFVVGYLVILAALLKAYVPHWLVSVAGLRTFHLSDIDAALMSITAESGTRPWFDAGNVGPVLIPHAGPIPLYEPALVFMSLATAALAWFVSWRVDLNEFSLHALYRNRIVRCYLGASNEGRSAHPFTGFDPSDDLPLAPATTTLPGLGRVAASAADTSAEQTARIRPYPLFNVALNLVGGRNLAWQQRKAASFVFSPEYCGFEYRIDEENEQQRTADPAGRREPARCSAYARTVDHAQARGSLTTGLAVATSGAAASPNMGYHSSPTLAFLMTVFNVRLGRWLRNPRWPDVWKDARTGLSLRELICELLGLTTDERAWVYLSDGGHFENLGVYELVRRRCRFILASDAGQDGAVTFEDLGNLIEKCRADFGVDIDIALDGLRPQGARGLSTWHCAIGTIHYDRQDPTEAPGTLLYLKSTLTGDEPADVLRYAALNPAFPHESTADQFFDESQFESYRALGYHIT